MAKFCTMCGNELDEKAVACPKCGNGIEKVSAPVEEKKSNGMAIAGFVLSFFFALLGLIFSIIGLNKSKETKSGRGLSIAGIIISSLSMVITLIAVILSFAFFTTEVGTSIIDEIENNIENNDYHYNYDYDYDDNYDFDFDFDD